MRLLKILQFAVLLAFLFNFSTTSYAETTVSVGFESGVIGEYRNNAHQPVNLKTFSTLGIASAIVSDSTDDGTFGGSQGNDYSVTVTLQFTNGSTTSFPAAINWRDMNGANNIHGIGLTIDAGTADGTSYTASTNFSKTYLFQFIGSSRVYADTGSNDGGVVSGNAANQGLLDSLNAYANASNVSINPSGLTSTITVDNTSILADGTSTTIVTVQLKDVNGNNLTTGGKSVTLSTSAGTLSGVTDNGDGTYTATLTSSTSVETATIVGTVDGLTINDDATVSFISNASIAGTVRGASGNGVSGRTVRLLSTSGQVLSTATTNSSGGYLFSNVSPGLHTIQFESVGQYRAKGKSSIGSNIGHLVSSLNVVTASTSLTGVDAVVVDPSGVVYDTVTRQPISSAVVTFLFGGSLVPDAWLDQSLGGSNTQTTGADGQYSFVLNSSASDGVYSIAVSTPTGYTFESRVISPSSGPYDSGLGGGIVSIQPQATAPTGSDSTTYYLDFSFTIGASPSSTSNGVINNHIPLDPTTVSVANTTDAAEPSTQGAFTVSLSNTSATDTVIAYNVSGSATSGTDYTALSGTVTVTAGQTTATISVPVIDDSLVEGNETVIVTLTGVTSGVASLSATPSDLTATNTLGDDDTNAAPVFTNQNAGDGTSYSFDYAEGSSTSSVLGQVSASDAEGDTLTFSITGGDTNGWYTINGSTGEIRLTAAGAASLANDFEQTPNTQTLTVTLSDGTNSTTVQVVVNETDLNDPPPSIIGPSGAPGVSASQVSVDEGQAGVTRLTADKPVTWSITGGDDQSKFQINEDGTITFLNPPVFETPTDSDANNSYILTVTARDETGNVSTLTLTVIVLDLDSDVPLITGPNGGQGASASAITINEGLTIVTTFTANEDVTWSIEGGSDAGKFQIDSESGAIVFLDAPDYETPTDVDQNNTYLVRVKAVDSAGNVSYQTLTVTIANVDEVGQRLSEISDELRTSLRSYAIQGLSDMLSFNESLMRGSYDDACSDPKALSRSTRADQNGGSIDLQYSKRLSECSLHYQLYADAGLIYSNVGGHWNSRVFSGLRFETKIDSDFNIGIGVLASRSRDEMLGFNASSISDKSLQVTAYGRYRITDILRTGVFAGVGRTWYDFSLEEGDGFKLDGSMLGRRQTFGWMLSGDWVMGDTVITTDAILSRAVERLGTASLSAAYLGENRSGIEFDVGMVDVTRISVPVTVPITLAGSAEEERALTRLLLSPGVLCEDNAVDSSSMRCGYQVGAKLVVNDDRGRKRFYADYRWESVDGKHRTLAGVGYNYRFGDQDRLELGFEANIGVGEMSSQDNSALITLKAAH